ncbi:hypothetical protein LSUB1_G007996 [Lachnellula subtilissima]|uniref:Uncharacterized protein n=1 Tax=Lachnellula subtilissima TaxID=602034 RepID=A0A8H8U5V0_9HELO|nr:hypothetical protein LSUB1_G007996 [Lachnellula subtilissima]
MSEKQQQVVQEEQQGGQENNQQLQHGSPTQQQSMEMSARGDENRPAPIRESRIKDRPQKDMNDSIKIKIELDLEVEVDLYARVQGDVTIGLM